MASPVIISISFRAEEDGQGSLALYCDAADVDTVAKAITVANTIIPIMFGDNQPSSAGVLQATVTFPLNLTAAQTAKPSAFIPAAGSRKDSGATLSFRNVNIKAFPIYIPAIKSEFIANKKVVVTPGGQMEGLINTIIAGVTGFKITDDNGLDLVSYREGNQSTRKG